MVICDRCGKKITNTKDKPKKTLTVYAAQAAYIGHIVDLCDECQREFENYIGKAESYFMVNKDNPVNIFDDVKYWVNE